jgi:hypothetical protein
MCYGGIDLKHLQRETEGRLAGLPKVDALAAPRLGVMVRGVKLIHEVKAKVLLLLAPAILTGCLLVDENRYGPERQELTFTLNFAPDGAVCDARAASGAVVERSSDILGAPRVRVKGYAQTATITCTMPDGSAFTGNFPAQLPFGAYRFFETSAIFNRRDAALTVRARSGDLVGDLPNAMVRVP